ncbi:MAG: hypothetical protein JW888_13180 [Pirellulales bacterium]|nr:hypothetical protein [Pirellulales bacterium]
MKRICLYHSAAGRRAYTLVEMLLSVLLTLIMMAFVVQIFGLVGNSVNDSRAVLEINDQLRSATARLRMDLQSTTADMTPPLSTEAGKGFFQITEGSIGPVYPLNAITGTTDLTDLAIDSEKPDGTYESGYEPDSTVIDNDDVLMFTVRSPGEPFVGRVFVINSAGTMTEQQSVESQLAEVCWFVRGTTLYRRVLLIKPEFDWKLSTPAREELTFNDLYATGTGLFDLAGKAPADRGFYNNFDLSVHLEGYDPSNPGNTAAWRWVPNTLANLTKLENRFVHQPGISGTAPANLAEYAQKAFPFHPQVELSSGVLQTSGWRYLRLPTLRECSWCADPTNVEGAWWPGAPLPVVQLSLPASPPSPFTAPEQFDAWNNPLPFESANVKMVSAVVPSSLDPDTGTIEALNGPRVAEDVILNNVIGFDVKVWDPAAPLVEVAGVCLAPGDPGYAAAYQKVLNGQPGAVLAGSGAYVDLGYGPINNVPTNTSWFSGPGTSPMLRNVYDTWSTHYEKDGINQDSAADTLIDEGTDGFDNDNDGLVDETDEREAPPPYERPLRGIQIKIRVFELDSRQIREVTIVEDFLPE